MQTTVTRQAVTLYAMVTFDHRLIPLGIMYINMHIKNANICILSFQIHVLPKHSECVV